MLFSTRSFNDKGSGTVRYKIKCRIIGCKDSRLSVTGYGVIGARLIDCIAFLLSLFAFRVVCALFVGLDVADLTTVGTLSLGACWLSSSGCSSFAGRFPIGF